MHYNLRLLSHYCDRANEDQSYKVWDNNLEDDNLEDNTIHLEELEAELLRYEDEAIAAMPPPHPPLLTQPPPTSSRSPSPSSYGRGTQETTRRPPLPHGFHKLNISRGKRPSNR